MYRRGFSFHHTSKPPEINRRTKTNEFTMISSEYDEDFVQYLLEIEDAFHPDSSYLTSVYARPSLRRPRSLTSYERDSTIEWVLDFNHKFGFGTEETIFLAINIIDRYLSLTRGSSEDNPYPSILKLRLIAGAAVFIAWKVDKGAHPRMSYLIELSRLPYDGEDVEEIELDILKALDYRITPYCSAVDWMERLLNCASLVPEDLERPLSLFLLHVSAANHEFLSWKPRRIAACAVFTARRFFDLFWVISYLLDVSPQITYLLQDQAFVFYSGGYEEATLVEGYRMFLDRLDEEQWEGPVWSLGFPVAAFAVNRASTLLREDAMPQYT
ncbi:cyclin-like protein [Cyathus striatus]|nr:cyclin-like protein [Cyathus striatus]